MIPKLCFCQYRGSPSQGKAPGFPSHSLATPDAFPNFSYCSTTHLFFQVILSQTAHTSACSSPMSQTSALSSNLTSSILFSLTEELMPHRTLFGYQLCLNTWSRKQTRLASHALFVTNPGSCYSSAYCPSKSVHVLMYCSIITYYITYAVIKITQKYLQFSTYSFSKA